MADFSKPTPSHAIVSFNMHGFNQGASYLDYICSSNMDLIFLQETWLSSDSLLKSTRCFSTNYNIFCSSPMDVTLSKGLLRGRPYGGLCILFRCDLFAKFNHVECLVADANFIILKADKLLLINVYFPNVQSDNDYDALSVILDNIIGFCACSDHDDILVGGDINCNVLNQTRTSRLINSKFASIDICHSYNFRHEKYNKSITFSASGRDAHSLINFSFCLLTSVKTLIRLKLLMMCSIFLTIFS